MVRHCTETYLTEQPVKTSRHGRCVPKSLRETVLRENHDAPSAGHVPTRLAARYYWPGMHRDASPRKKMRDLLTQVPEEPWATVCADFLGPLPRSKHGNQMLLVMMDRFSIASGSCQSHTRLRQAVGTFTKRHKDTGNV